MTVHLSDYFEKAIYQLGYSSVNEFAEKNIKREFSDRVAFYTAIVENFEKKYGMKYEEFSKRVIDTNDAVLSKFGIIEKENDDFEWNDAVDLIEDYSNKILNRQ
jgi:hypothetical protein